MKFDHTVEFGQSLSWWPVSKLLAARRSHGVRRVIAVWSGATLVSIFLALIEARFNWSGTPLTLGGWTLGFTFYPPVIVGVLLTLWIGPAYGAVSAYLSTLASGLYSALPAGQAAFFALGSPIELLLLWFLLLILRVQPSLPRLRDWALFASAALIAATASSVDIMLYSAAHHVPIAEGRRLWIGWILGDVFQIVILVGPILRRFGAQVHARTRRTLGIPPRREISTSRILLLSAFVWITLGLLVFLGVRLLEQALEIPEFAITLSGDPLLPRLREMGLFIGVFVIVLLLTMLALTVALAEAGSHHLRQSLRDDLTGCFNRRAFRRLFNREAERSAGLGLPLSVVFFDIDRFKALNDRYGHATGDSVLAEVAHQATEMLSPQELLFRWGGEEFLVLLSHTRPEEARLFAERLRLRIEQGVKVAGLDPGEPVTVSLGVASDPPPEYDEINLIRRADSALYQAKNSGRNRVVTDREMGA